jgi:hypothetical protein
MFLGCTKLRKVTFGPEWDTTGVTRMDSMFDNCTALKSITFGSGWNTVGVIQMHDMFAACYSLEKITFNTKWILPTDTDSMFWGCCNLEHMIGASKALIDVYNAQTSHCRPSSPSPSYRPSPSPSPSYRPSPSPSPSYRPTPSTKPTTRPPLSRYYFVDSDKRRILGLQVNIFDEENIPPSAKGIVIPPLTDLELIKYKMGVDLDRNGNRVRTQVEEPTLVQSSDNRGKRVMFGDNNFKKYLVYKRAFNNFY